MTPPKRMYELKIKVGAENVRTIIAQLEEWIIDIEQRGAINSVTGGTSLGGYCVLEHNPEMTNEKYFKELEIYRHWEAQNRAEYTE